MNRRTRGEVSIGVIVAGVLFVLAIAAGVLYFLKFRGTVAVPEVVGMTWTDAKLAIQNAKLKPTRQDVERSAGKPGVVARQDPMGGSRRKPGSVIALDVPGGADLVELPSLVGKSASTTQRTLQRLGLEYVLQGHKPDTRRPGTVVEQNPKGGIEVLKGTPINIYLSSGADLRPVPKLVSMTQEEAEKEALRKGFVLEVIGEETAMAKGYGRVVHQVPPGDSLVDPNATLIKVSLSSDHKDRAPTLLGMSLEEARRIGRELKMTIRVEEGDDDPRTVIVSQDPPPGGTVMAGIAVRTLASVPVPELEGETLQDAYETATQSGFPLQVTLIAGDGEPGIIANQEPKAGTLANPRTTISVSVTRMRAGTPSPAPGKAAPKERPPSPGKGGGPK